VLRSLRSLTVAFISAVIVIPAATLLGAPPAAAVVSCTTTTPAINETITCNPGTFYTQYADVTVPTGASAVTVTVDGGAGSGDGTNSGGSGARVEAILNVTSLSTLRVQVAPGQSSPFAGYYSAIYAGASSDRNNVLVIAGGGGAGGDGGDGGSGATASTPAGGDGTGTSPGLGAPGDGNGGSGGGGGSGGTSWSSSGGIGGAGDTFGGWGYGGGGGSRDGGSGAGGSFAEAAYLIGTATFSPNGAAGGTGAGADGQVILTFSATPSPSPKSPRPPAATFTIELNTGDEGSCTQREMSAVGGTWMNLPAAADCTPPADTPDATLLGWATDQDFPIDRAKHQVEKGWGAYETFNDSGRLTGVFIPAGGAAFVTNDVRVYSIWSN